jgi:hypothetical protein
MLVCLGALAGRAAAQTPINSFASMQPSKNTWLIHQMFYVREFEAHPTTDNRDLREIVALTQIGYGLLDNLSLNLDLSLVHHDFDASATTAGDTEFGVGDPTALLKWRLFRDDTGPTDTMRFSAIGGMHFPGDIDTFNHSSSDSFNPVIGGVFSIVRGRHGFNADALWEFVTDDGPNTPDIFHYDASYLFRVHPAAYSAEQSGAAWYGVMELNGLYETNGDNELFLSPGVMYEARTFTIDATVQIPIWQDLDDRPETEITFGVGVRLPF